MPRKNPQRSVTSNKYVSRSNRATSRARVLAAGGDPDEERICSGQCGMLKSTLSFTPGMSACRECRNLQLRAPHGIERKKRKPQ